jgi:hypothetical protein
MNTRRNKARDGTETGGWLHLTASPTFAAMALVTAITGDDPASMLCQAMGRGSLSLDGMTFMYLLMAIFHAAPWWQWIVLRARGHARTKKICTPESAALESR